MADNNSHHEDASVAALQAAIRHHVRYSLGKEWQHLSGPELFRAVALAVRERLVPLAGITPRVLSAARSQISPSVLFSCMSTVSVSDDD